MRDDILRDIEGIINTATYSTERLKFTETQYQAGKLSGILFACRAFGYYPEAELCMNVLNNYPFKGEKPIDIKKVLSIKYQDSNKNKK